MSPVPILRTVILWYRDGGGSGDSGGDGGSSGSGSGSNEYGRGGSGVDDRGYGGGGNRYGSGGSSRVYMYVTEEDRAIGIALLVRRPHGLPSSESGARSVASLGKRWS